MNKTKNYQKHKDAQRARRAKRWERKRTGEEPNANLAFLNNIIRSLGFTWASFARAIGISQQLMHYFLLMDDILLSEVQDWLSRLGIKLNVHFDGGKPLPVKPTSSALNIVWRAGILPVKKKSTMDYQVARLADSGSRIGFVAKLISESGLSVHEFYARLGVPRTTFGNWLERDDIRVSILYRMAEMTYTRLVWTLEKANRTE